MSEHETVTRVKFTATGANGSAYANETMLGRWDRDQLQPVLEYRYLIKGGFASLTIEEVMIYKLMEKI